MAFEYIIDGGKPLRGQVKVGRSKLASAFAVAASVLTEDAITIKNISRSQSTEIMLQCIQFLGGVVEDKGDTIKVSMTNITTKVIPSDYFQKSNYVVLLAAALFARTGRAAIGTGSKDKAALDSFLEKIEPVLSTPIREENDFFSLSGVLQAKEYYLPDKDPLLSAFAILMSARGTQSILLKNLAEDPEVDHLLTILEQMEASVDHIEQAVVRVKGKNRLRGTDLTIGHDKDETVFLSLAVAATGGEATLHQVYAKELTPLSSKLIQLGIKVRPEADSLHIWHKSDQYLQAVDVNVRPYPGFSEQWARWFMPLLTKAKGISQINSMVPEFANQATTLLKKYGAEIKSHETDGLLSLQFFGPTKLHAPKEAISVNEEIMVGLLVALVSEGVTTMKSDFDTTQYFENLVPKLQQLGASIESI